MSVQQEERGKLMGLRPVVNRIAQMLSPATFGALAGAFGLSAAFSGGGVFLLATMFGFSAVVGRPQRGGGA